MGVIHAARAMEGTSTVREQSTSSAVVISDQGLLVVEVIDSNDSLIGAALIAVGSDWAALLASAGRAVSPPTFTPGGGSVTVGGSTSSRRVRWRRVGMAGPGAMVLS
jgi:hypothetical protein